MKEDSARTEILPGKSKNLLSFQLYPNVMGQWQSNEKLVPRFPKFMRTLDLF